MSRPMDKLADALASISIAEEALEAHTPAACPACASAFSSQHYLVCGEERDWTAYLSHLLTEARKLTAQFLADDASYFNEDEEDLLRAAAPMLDSYRRVLEHSCPECRGGTWCPPFVSLRDTARKTAGPVQQAGSRILARTCP